MRLHLLFPLAFLSGIYGFFFFAPYLIAIVAVAHLVRGRRLALASQSRRAAIQSREVLLADAGI